MQINIPYFFVTIFTFMLSHIAYAKDERRFTYHESDGIYIYYETQEKAIYRSLLPKEFDMPDNLYVYTFISDFYKMDARTDPYKEASIFLLAKYKGHEIWHCIFMPVTSELSRIVGIRRLGLPKTMGNIQLTRSSPIYSGTATTEDGRTMSLSINTQDYEMSKPEEDLIRELCILPKLNIKNGKVIEMTGGRKTNLIDVSKRYPKKLLLSPGKAEIEFKPSSNNNNSIHALDLSPSRILGGYYLLNKITFRLGQK